MIGRATIKRTVKQTAGWAAVLSSLVKQHEARNQACIFYYHRIADVGFMDSQVDDWNVTPERFARHISKLTSFAQIVPLRELPERIKTQKTGDRTLVSLTFDDGYSNFYSQALPILKQFNAPATAFIVTGVVGSPEPMPFDHWARRNVGRVGPAAWRPLNWMEIEECVASGLITIGAHSHNHLRGSQSTAAQILDEVGLSREILRARLGENHAIQYAYPYGNSKLGDVSGQYMSAVKAAGFQLAVTTDLALAHPDSDPFCLPRLEAHMMDSPGVLKAKAVGALAPYRMTDHLRGAYRA